MSIEYYLWGFEPKDLESDSFTRTVTDSRNNKLHLWTSGTNEWAFLYSEKLKIGVNCEIGESIITVSYRDSKTGAITNLPFRLEILSRNMY